MTLLTTTNPLIILSSKFRTFHRSLYGLPFKTHPTTVSSSSSSPSFLFYQLYALNLLRHHQSKNSTTRSSINTCRTTITSLGTNVSVSTCNSSNFKENKPKQTCFFQYRYCSICILILILLFFFLITIFLLILNSKFSIHLSSCYCPNGYEQSLSSTSSCTCIDRNECLNDHTCTDLNMQCINTMGSYICRCRPGFIRRNDQNSCIDINECDLYQPCNTSISTCVNLPGRYYCQCLMNETKDEQCIPRNICIEQNDLCGLHSECVVSSSNGYKCQVMRHYVKCDKKKSICLFVFFGLLVSTRSCYV